MKFEGVMTAVVSPFKNNKLDLDSFKKLIQSQYESGIKCIVINGTTGESPSLEWEEINSLVSTTRENIPEMKIILGAGGNSTHKVVAMAKKAEALGVDAILSVVPYYNKPSQEGIYRHFEQVAKAVKCPVVLYNVPGRTITSMELETIKRLSKIENIVAIKEASGDPQFIKEIVNQIPDFKVLSGDDGSYLQSALLGCHGVISVISHNIPKQFIDWTNRAKKEDKSILQEFEAYKHFCDLLFAEPNPVPVKACLQMTGVLATDELRLPLVSCTEELKSKLKSEMEKLNIGR